MQRAFVRFLLGFVAGVLLWSVTLTGYTRLLASVSAPLIRLDRRFHAAAVIARGATIHVSSAQRGFPALDFRADQITYNLILLVALFAANRAPFRDRNVVRFLVSLLITCAVHFAATLCWIEASYAVVFGDWSAAHYGSFAANVWLGLQMFYQIVGMFGVVFICWWVASPDR